ncbi:RND superfamily putative drug exporter [Microbacteriaceae bacterium SG_E_30_P1]|uniref:RND superfamily putative drug exporter n=1 Tax=Antiquaquibacter oligotrophicus TaxID=2880260 RepID=A0ABT6KNP2_9MICO|nr:MMPL family transporter [Antiquaquibacter oligotrophicus]MDH6181618.1 RND superfamily putative drug exporter [Antiquaquibacter oligotrophicus]UDF12697.1 MMPL family transporter [Antiquaquibacter oligotrophicus]
MATLLYRLGRFSYRHAWRVILVWAVLLLGILGGGFALGGQTQESFAIPGTESQNALDRLEAVFPSVAGASAQVVLVAPEGDTVTSAASEEGIADLVSELETINGVDSVISPFSEYAGEAVTDDESMAIVRVQFDGASTEVTDATLDEVKATASIAEDAGLRAEFGGQVFQDNTFGITITEAFGVIFAGVVLFITFGSLLAAGMPLLSALVGVGIAIGGITAYTAFATVSSTAPLLALMIGLAVGIDYALFVLSRHRNQLANGEDPEESAAMAVGTAGSAVVFAGVTVIIALLGLLVVGIPFLSVMGVGAAFAVLIAIGVAVTLLPALMGLAKGRLAPKEGSRAWRRAQAVSDSGGPARSMGQRWVRGVMKHPLLVSLGVVALLGTLAIPALSLDLNVPDGGSEPAGSTQREAYDLITEGFGPGYNGPLIVAVDITQTTDILDDLDAIRDRLSGLDDVAYVQQGFPDETLDTAIIQVTPESAPDSTETKQLVESIRALAPEIEDEFDTPISVTGTTAVAIDISNRLSAALLPFALVVVGLSIVLLMIVFRSVLVPLKAALGFLLSVAASFGVVVAIFQWGWGAELLHVDNPGPILSFLPILLMAVLFGLAMDYEVFLVSGMREEFVHTGDAKRAVEKGFAGAARVVTAAALIMFFVFFAFVPEGSGMIKPIALGLAAGIAFDAFLVRMTLVPALMTLFGKAAWWMPRWLGKALPHADIEGEQLRDHRAATEWANNQQGMAISADYLVVGTPSEPLGPLSIEIPEGALVIASGDASARRVLAATLSGRLDPVSGRAQVLGVPLPSDAARVRSLVALANVGGSERSETTVTVGRLLAERLETTQPWYRFLETKRNAEAWVERINQVLRRVATREVVRVRASHTLMELPQLERAVALAAVALAERTPVIMLDQLDSFASSDDEQDFIAALEALAPASTTIVLGTPLPARALDESSTDARLKLSIDLYSLTTEGSLR